MKNVNEISHPLILSHLSRMREKSTSPDEFRNMMRRITRLVTYEATKDLATVEREVETPVCKMMAPFVDARIGLVPILRAGLGMIDPVLDLIPEAEVWHLGFYRDENTFKPVEYYKKFPDNEPVDVALVLDPMLATGGSAVAALKAVYDWNVERVKMISIIAAPEGIERVHRAFPDTQIYVCSIDSHLNENAYIVPGLGDAGDRIFNATA